MSARKQPKRVRDYVIERIVGQGGFATVYEAIDLRTQKKVAIKCIWKEKSIPIEEYRKEVEILLHLDSPFIAPLYQSFEDSAALYIVMEFVDGPNLCEYLNLVGAISELASLRMFLQLISAIDYLHNEMKIIHRDLKLENILIDKNDCIRIIDFGLSAEFTNQKNAFRCKCGSIPYLSPEMAQGNEYSSAIDIWCLGVVLYALNYGHLPFSHINEGKVCKSIMYSDPKFPQTKSPELIDILTKILDKDPLTRITLNEIKEHEWIRNLCAGYEINIFYTLPKLNDIDPNLLHQISESPSEQARIVNDIEHFKLSPNVTKYRIFRRDFVMNELNCKIQGFTNRSKTITIERMATQVISIPFARKSSINPAMKKIFPSGTTQNFANIKPLLTKR